MKRSIALAVVALLLAAAPAMAVQFGPISIAAHFIPNVEAGDEGRHWDVSLAVGFGLTLDEIHAFEIHVLTDSQLTSLGTTVLYRGTITQRLQAGLGLTVLWPFDEQERLLKPVIEAYAHARTHALLGPIFRGELSTSLPLLTLAPQVEGWDIAPLADMPSLSAAAEVDLSDDAVFQGKLTLQPIIVDTTQLVRPIGRVSDNLLVLPLASGILRYMP